MELINEKLFKVYKEYIKAEIEEESESQEEEDSKRSYFMKKVNQKNGKENSLC